MGKKRKISNLVEGDHIKGKKNGGDIADKNTETCSNAKKKVKNTSEQDTSNATESIQGIPPDASPPITESLTKKSKNKSSKGKKKQKQALVDSKPDSVNENMIKKSTKIRFVDDAPQVVSTETEQEPSKTKKTNKQNHQQNEEDEVNDEDIDKFCEEITEEDNEQFDNWVKLIEAKLHSKKK